MIEDPSSEPVRELWSYDRSPEHQVWWTEPDNEGLPSATSNAHDTNMPQEHL